MYSLIKIGFNLQNLALINQIADQKINIQISLFSYIY